MNRFDRDEQVIHSALSGITVNINGLSEKVMERINNQAPRMAARRMSFSAAIAAVMITVLTVTAAAMAIERYERIIGWLNPAFSDYVMPVENCSINKGIRLEVIGAQTFGNMAVIYYSLQDVTGQNRLTVRTNIDNQLFIKAGNALNEAGLAGYGYNNLINFDEETNTAYYELNVATDFLPETLELGSNGILFDIVRYEAMPVPIQAAGLADAETIQTTDGTFLVPGYYAPMPHDDSRQWISNIALMYGKLHIQTTTDVNDAYGPSAPWFMLTKNGNPINYPVYMQQNSSDSHVFHEFVFDIGDEDPGSLTLTYNGTIALGTEGFWSVAAQPEDAGGDVYQLERNILIENHRFEIITLTPLGLQATGSFDPHNLLPERMEFKISLVTFDEVITLGRNGGGYDFQNYTFYKDWVVRQPINMADVMAIIINDIPIPVN